MKLGYVSVVVALGVGLMGCAPIAVNKNRLAGTTGTCGTSAPCVVVVSVDVTEGARCTLAVKPDWLYVTGKAGEPVPIVWKLDAAGYKVPQGVGVTFDNQQFSNQESGPSNFVVIDAKKTYGWFKYTVNVIGADGLSYCTPLDPWIFNEG